VAPHRAHLLRILANVSLACGLAALVLGAPAVVGLPLGLAVAVLADRDLERMGMGGMDPRGRAETWQACQRSRRAMALSLLSPFACLILWCCILSILHQFV
jgi:hypothetical protein